MSQPYHKTEASSWDVTLRDALGEAKMNYVDGFLADAVLDLGIALLAVIARTYHLLMYRLEAP